MLRMQQIKRRSIRVGILILFKHSNGVISTSCGDEIRQRTPADVVHRPGVKSGQSAHAFPRGFVVCDRDTFWVSWEVLAPYFHCFVVAARRQVFAVFVKRETPNGGLVGLESSNADPIVIRRIFLEKFDCVIVRS